MKLIRNPLPKIFSNIILALLLAWMALEDPLIYLTRKPANYLFIATDCGSLSSSTI